MARIANAAREDWTVNMPKVAAAPAARRTRKFWRGFARDLRRLFGRAPRQQFGALCHRTKKKKGSVEILLITSRDTGRWVIPKGWPMEGRGAHEVAAREAYEEAGVRGVAGEAAIGRFAYGKALRCGVTVRCVVEVHPLKVTAMEKKFPERRQRTLCWFTPEEAAARVNEPGLKEIILNFRP